MYNTVKYIRKYFEKININRYDILVAASIEKAFSRSPTLLVWPILVKCGWIAIFKRRFPVPRSLEELPVIINITLFNPERRNTIILDIYSILRCNFTIIIAQLIHLIFYFLPYPNTHGMRIHYDLSNNK